MGDVVFGLFNNPVSPARKLQENPYGSTIQTTLSGGRLNGVEFRSLVFDSTHTQARLSLTMRSSGTHEILVGNDARHNGFDCRMMFIDDQVLRDLHDQIEAYFSRKADQTLVEAARELEAGNFLPG